MDCSCVCHTRIGTDKTCLHCQNDYLNDGLTLIKATRGGESVYLITPTTIEEFGSDAIERAVRYFEGLYP